MLPPVCTQYKDQLLPNGQPRTLDFSRPGPSIDPPPVNAPFQQENYPPPILEFTSAELPLARLTDKSDSVMAIGKGLLKIKCPSVI